MSSAATPARTNTAKVVFPYPPFTVTPFALKSTLLLPDYYCLEKRRLRGELIAVCQHLKGAYKKDGDKHFSGACCDKTRGNGFKLKEGRF